MSYYKPNQLNKSRNKKKKENPVSEYCLHIDFIY